MTKMSYAKQVGTFTRNEAVTMSTDDSVTHWFEQIREGDSEAARAIWERYFPELVRLAREKLRGVPRRVADEEDIAASVMKSFFRAAQKGRFPDLADRHELWRLLLQMTARKVVDSKHRLRLIRKKWL
jgi:hypothetical protein